MAQKPLTQSSGAPFAGFWPFGTGSTAQPSSKTIGHIGSRIVLALALIAIAAAGSLFAFRVAYADQIYPGVHVGGVNVGGMNNAEAAATIQAKADEITSQRAYFDGFDQHWAPTLAELGVKVDLNASIEQAMAIGREDSSTDRLGSAVSSLSRRSRSTDSIDHRPENIAGVECFGRSADQSHSARCRANRG